MIAKVNISAITRSYGRYIEVVTGLRNQLITAGGTTLCIIWDMGPLYNNYGQKNPLITSYNWNCSPKYGD